MVGGFSDANGNRGGNFGRHPRGTSKRSRRRERGLGNQRGNFPQPGSQPQQSDHYVPNYDNRPSDTSKIFRDLLSRRGSHPSRGRKPGRGGHQQPQHNSDTRQGYQHNYHTRNSNPDRAQQTLDELNAIIQGGKDQGYSNPRSGHQHGYDTRPDPLNKFNTRPDPLDKFNTRNDPRSFYPTQNNEVNVVQRGNHQHNHNTRPGHQQSYNTQNTQNSFQPSSATEPDWNIHRRKNKKRSNYTRQDHQHNYNTWNDTHSFQPTPPVELFPNFHQQNDYSNQSAHRGPQHNYNTRNKLKNFKSRLEDDLDAIIYGEPVFHGNREENFGSESTGYRTICYALANELLNCQQLHLGREFVNSISSPTSLRDFSMESAPSPTPVLDQFLDGIAQLIQAKDGKKLQDFLQLEPPLRQSYLEIAQEVSQRYPAGADKGLEERCEELVPLDQKETHPWNAFPVFMKMYFNFLRDMDKGDLLETHDLLKALLNQCMLALSHTTMGVIVLQTVLYLSKVLAKFALGLDRRPELIADLKQKETSTNEEQVGEKVTLVEGAANVLREAFIKCLNDKTGSLTGLGRRGKPEGKRWGIYMTANLCLKLLFQCRKLRNAQQMFASVDTQSPPLSYFPASQRVTYLYYLGRYHFSNNHFFRAQLALQSAYNQCLCQSRSLTYRHYPLKQRHLILVYLITSNIILGRFPSSKLLSRPEVRELPDNLADKFLPLCNVIRKGDVAAFEKLLHVKSETAQWFLQKKILLQLRNRCEILVWRSLARKVFLVAGYHGDGNAKAPPQLNLWKLQAAVRWLEKQASRPALQEKSGNAQTGRMHTNWVFMQKETKMSEAEVENGRPQPYVDPEFEGMDEAIEEFGYPGDDESYYNDGLEDVDLGDDHRVTELDDGYSSPEEDSPTMRDVESVIASLINQDLMHGYLTHVNPRFAIPGAKIRGAVPTGFPNVWKRIEDKADKEVPGWVTEETPAGAGGGFGGLGGRVIHLSGARPAGAPLG